jgi:type I restriction enzyme R subunit
VAENDETDMEELYRSMAKRGRQANLSFFAFTATPKHKTLKVFGGQDGKPAHRYTMRQAIEEGFILDVLSPSYQFDDEVRLEYYRLQKISEGSINLSDGQTNRLDGPSEVGSGVLHEEAMPLSRLIDVVNDRFGTDFNQADQLFFDQIVEAAISDNALREAAAVNPGDKFELVFKNLLEALFVERMDQNEEIFARFMNDKSFQKVVTGWLSSVAYRKLRPATLGEGTAEDAV